MSYLRHAIVDEIVLVGGIMSNLAAIGNILEDCGRRHVNIDYTSYR